MRSPLRSRLRGFLAREDGVISVLNLFIFMGAACVGAAAVDVTNVFGARAQLQVAADVAAHAALFNSYKHGVSDDDAVEVAIAAAQVGLPEETFGDVLVASDVRLGWWDGATETFHVGNPQVWDEEAGVWVEGSPTAAMVTTRREQAGGNPVSTFLFRMVGVGWLDVEATAVFTTYQPACIEEGFAANGVVDVQSNNGYFGGFCMHSNSHVSLNMNNYFEDGTIVSMPNLEDLDIPDEGLEGNEGLEEALHESFTYLHILDRIRTTATDPLYGAIRTPGQSERPAYVTSSTEVTRNISSNTSVAPSAFTPSSVHVYTCNNANRKVTLTPGVYENIVLLTNCQVDISGGATMQNMILYTTNTSATSVQVSTAGGGSVGLQLGKADGCATGGGAQIITRGGFRNSAKLTMNGSRIIALGEVNFAAQAVGHGASIISDSGIDGTSNMSFTGCGVPADDPFEYPYFRAAW